MELKRLDYKVNDYWKAFSEYCQKIKEEASKQGKGVILSGDFNVAHNYDLDIHVPKKLKALKIRDKQPGFTL